MTAVAVKDPHGGALLTPADALHVLAGLAPESRVLSRRLVAPRPLAPRSRRRLDRQPAAIYLNLMPLIDVVFQLLVFFIATTHFATNEHVLRMDLPPRSVAAAGTAAADPAPAEASSDPFAYVEDALRIEVLPGGAIRTTAPVAAATTAESLQTLLALARRDESNPAGSLPPTFPIVIAPVKGTTWHDAVCALNAAAGAGFRNVSFDQPAAEVAK